MLILFDIDATLIHTNRSGLAAMGDAGRALFGPAFTTDGVDFAGRLDPLIIDELLTLNRQHSGSAARFRATYIECLKARLAVPGVGRALPGVPDVLGALRARRGVVMGLLTGNFAETGRMKLSACGIDADAFAIQVWGDDSPHAPPRRGHLPPVALDRYRARFGDIEPRRACIIGDTPHDVAAAREHGLRCLGVATGRFSIADLRGAGADLVLPDLADTRVVLDWILECGLTEPA